MRDALRSGWFIVALLSVLLLTALINRLMWWAIFFAMLAVLLTVAEIVCYAETGMTLSEQFGRFYARNRSRGRWFLVMLIAVVVGLVVHLVAWRG